MNDIYKTPSSELETIKGVDGKTCPVCERHISWQMIYFGNLVPNSYKCPNCKSKLKYNLSKLFNVSYCSIVFVYCLGLLIYFDKVLGLERGDRLEHYIIFGLVPGITSAFVVTAYCRKKLKLIEKGTDK